MISRKLLFSDVIFKSLRISKNVLDFQTLNLMRNHSTFHEWTLNYFRSQPYYNEFVLKPTTIESNNLIYDTTQLKTVSTNELLIKLLSSNIKLFNDIDSELVNRINNMSINQILVLMDACLSGKYQLFKISKSFTKCMEVMDELWFRRPDLTASQTIQLIYYVSIYKNKSKSIVEYGLQKLINEFDYVKQLTNEELSVLGVATYKCSAKVNDKMLRVFANRIENNLEKLIQTPLQFVSLIKPLKRAKYQDPVMLTKLIVVLNNNDNKIMKDVISGICLLTYLADSNCSNVKFLQTLIDSIGNIMVKEKLKNFRIKDVSNYVFSASCLGLLPKDDVCKIIINFLDQIFNTKEKCKKRSKTLVGMCLSMWMLDYKPIKLITIIFSEMSIADLRMPNAHKQDNRLNLLLTCVLIEQPNLIMRCQFIKDVSNTMPKVYTHLGERPFLVNVFQTLQELSHKLDISKVKYNFNIPNLKILGIEVIKNNGKIVYIEVLDNSTCLYKTQIPNGMMKLKLRLESKLNYTVITVNYKEIYLNNQKLLKCHLESIISS